MRIKKSKPAQGIKKILLAYKQELREKYGVREIGIFGSYVRNDNRKNSDIDILVELEKPMGFFKFIKLERYLSELLGTKVDLVTKNALKPHIGQRILAEVIYV
ncbi:MAG: nucleotidyltransferase family protein [Acidobacteriota bacterium]